MQILHKPKASPRRLTPVNLPSLLKVRERLIAQYDSGIIKLALAINRAIERAKTKQEFKEVWDALRQLLQRYWYDNQWKRGLKVYRLRNEFAYR